MILVSEKNNNYVDFDWEKYRDNYPDLITKGFTTKEQLWWHYVHIGETENYTFYSIHDITVNNTCHLNNIDVFDDITYDLHYPHLKMDGFLTKEQLFWHYSNIGIKRGYTFFHVNQTAGYSIRRNELEITHLSYSISNNAVQSRQLVINKPTIYYYIGHTCQDTIRTGIQIVSIYLAKEYINSYDKHNFEMIFVKWDNLQKAIVPCNPLEIHFFFNYNEKNDVRETIIYTDYHPIHLNKARPLSNCKLFFPELTFVQYKTLPKDLNIYLNTHHLYSIFILYDIIPLVLPEYNIIYDDFKNYVYSNLLNANKIITISEFTKTEFLKYMKDNNQLPKLVSIKLPYQYRNKCLAKPSLSCIQDKVTILLPGTIEPRKQQILLMKLFIKFIKENPTINVELITFGNVVHVCKEDLEQCIHQAQGKINYVGIIDNETLFYLYKNSTFLCFISKYEGYGFPISESLWHGMPVLTSSFGSMAEVASCGGCYCVDTTDEAQVYDALNTLIKNPKIIEKLKNEINSNSFTSWNDYSKQVYHELVNYLPSI